jgi:hypothetical protein
MKRFVLAIAVSAFFVLAAIGQSSTNADSGKAKFVTSDIDNFWRAFDLAQKEPDFEKRVAIYQAEYLEKGSVGLKDFIRLRIKYPPLRRPNVNEGAGSDYCRCLQATEKSFNITSRVLAQMFG